jgi:hypothetical protein
MTSALEGNGGGVNVTPWPLFTPGKDPVTIVNNMENNAKFKENNAKFYLAYKNKMSLKIYACTLTQ